MFSRELSLMLLVMGLRVTASQMPSPLSEPIFAGFPLLLHVE